MSAVARHLMIHGRVQGVWYRAWTVETARELGLVGWVRNRMDGSVEALVQGEAALVERFVTLAHEGPPAAQVMRIEATEATVESLGGFEKRATA
jgi:acylphosphatase